MTCRSTPYATRVRTVLDDASYRRSAERIQTEIHEMPDARDAVTRIETLTTG